MRQWKIKSQILILQIIANLLVASLVAGYLLFVQNLLIKQQEQDQRKMLLQKIEILTTEALQQYARSIEYVNYQSQQSIRSIQEIFLIMQRYNIYSKENSGICEYFKKETNQFCYLIPNQSSETNISDYFTLTNLLDSLKHQIPVEKLYFVSSQEDQYFSIFPTFVLKNYFPHSRPWYKNHQVKSNTSLYVLSDPYISMFSGVMFTETTTLKDKHFLQKGVIGHDFNMSSFSVFNFQIDGIKISLIDMVGRLLISSYYSRFSNTKIIINKIDCIRISHQSLNLFKMKVQQVQMNPTFRKYQNILYKKIIKLNVYLNQNKHYAFKKMKQLINQQKLNKQNNKYLFYKQKKMFINKNQINLLIKCNLQYLNGYFMNYIFVLDHYLHQQYQIMQPKFLYS